jgi:hypothetical protein
LEIKGQERLPLGVVVERREIENRWIKHRWTVVAVVPGAPPLDPRAEWRELASGEGWVHFHAGTLPLSLYPRETEGYRLNLSQQPPRLFVVLRDGADMDSRHDRVAALVTACPYEAQDYLDSGEEQVEAVTMPEAVAAFVSDFVERHHVDERFEKRKRKRWAERSAAPGRRFSRVPGNGSDADG